jgi:hypothetical protein
MPACRTTHAMLGGEGLSSESTYTLTPILTHCDICFLIRQVLPYEYLRCPLHHYAAARPSGHTKD